jgi:hypothetical protein
MASEVEICNRALQKLGAKRISSLDDDNKNGRACNFAYSVLRDSMLRQHTWGFSVKRASLAADTTAPIFGETNYFSFPSDLLRLLPKVDSDWRVEGRKIATYDSAPLEIRYVRKVTDPNEMDGLFREALSAYIAAELTEEITQSNVKKDALMGQFSVAINEAKKTSSIESISTYPPEPTWITRRYDNSDLRKNNKYA